MAEESINLPHEIQRIIFETAAKLDGRSAYNLVLVANYVRDWIQPILYERIVIRNQKAALCLLQRTQAQDANHLFSLTKSLTVDKDIPQKLLKPLFAKLSKNIICFTIFRDIWDPDHLLRYIRSPLIRRLTLVYDDVQGTPLPFPLDISSSISHLTFISNTTYGGFSLYLSIQIAAAMQENDTAWLASLIDPIPLLSPFHRLTFIAISYDRWTETRLILTLAPKLKCFAVLLPTMSAIQFIKGCICIIRQKRDPRVVILTHHGDPVDWDSDQGFVPSTFWTFVENLSRKRYICDQGERWGEDIINDFRTCHPEISLVGD